MEAANVTKMMELMWQDNLRERETARHEDKQHCQEDKNMDFVVLLET